ncbi:Fe-S protein assembly co-chaperone HscB [Alginatibacterium sediminis]|uniref:Co-chaperone protein HscB homolog n=1 Tax=Alginatibacterium sediminis TaxID=2164068 RepID=A0A420E894_9ALTE|nr:Fe-S protein assembly co-chaperone HscB [Alginatibacterium sediminis]RKF15534.1 Fe-S protein assembly co-chaperone HscB [Alginatibacterium sediminis]
MNYFELFNLAPSYLPEPKALAQTYRTLQAQHHPDRFVTQDSQVQKQSMQHAAMINDAYQTLKNPLLCAQYMLQLQGIELKDEQQTLNDMPFLMQQMQLREQLEAIEASDDAEQQLEHFVEKLKGEQQNLRQDFVQRYQNNDFISASHSVRKMKFFVRLEQQCAQLEDQLLDD